MAGLVVLEKMVMLVLLMLVGFLAAQRQMGGRVVWPKGQFPGGQRVHRGHHFGLGGGDGTPLLRPGAGGVGGGSVHPLRHRRGAGVDLRQTPPPVARGPDGGLAVGVLHEQRLHRLSRGGGAVRQNAVFCAALTGLPFNLLLFSLGVSRLRAGQGRGRVRLREVFSPALIATLVSIVFFLGQIPFPQLVADTVQTLGGATVPLSMLIIGISLSRVPVKEAITDWRAYVVSLVRLILCPLVVWGVLRLFVSGTVLGCSR